MKTLVPLFLAFAVVACSTNTPPPAHPSDSALLKAIADEVWARQVENDIGVRVQMGLRVERMPDPSYKHAEENARFARGVVERLERIDQEKLGEEEWLTRQTLLWRQRSVADGLRHFWHLFSVTPYASPFRDANQALTEYRIETAEDGQRYVRLLTDFARLVDDLGVVAREQQRRGVLVPKPELPAVRGMLDGLRREPEVSMFRPDDSRLASLSRRQRERFSADVRSAIISVVNPALQRLFEVFRGEYEQAAPETVGMWQSFGGAQAYAHLMRLHTSLDMAPQEVHNLGLAEIDRLQRELDEVRHQVGFSGTPTEFHQFLKTDPRFFGKSAAETEERLMRYVRIIEPQIDKFFLRKPRAAYGVRRLDPSLEASMTFGYYKPANAADPIGVYYFNGSKPNERNLLFAASLMAHELVPGHHFQIARQAENVSLHPVRRLTYDTVFVEGWGEYSSELGREMGLYAEPYDRAGRIMADMMLSSRLVVDTGMNALGWSRERATEYLRDHTMLSETEIATETLRYSVDIPAQALAYKIGSIWILDLRRRAQEELGERFDIREFHEWVIGSGSMPMRVLEAWVARRVTRLEKE